jgi:DNA-directed RNA polymerase subunit K
MDKSMRYSRFERARIIGARALQITLGAPVLMDLPDEIIDPLIIATKEYDSGLIPITVRRQMNP